MGGLYLEHDMRTLAKRLAARREAWPVIFAAAALVASVGVAAAIEQHPAPQPANQYQDLGRVMTREPGLVPESIDRNQYERSGTRGREELGESPFHPEGPGDVSD